MVWRGWGGGGLAEGRFPLEISQARGRGAKGADGLNQTDGGLYEICYLVCVSIVY